MAALIAPPPRETPFFGRDGRISEPWLAWFLSITSTGAIVQNLQILQTITDSSTSSPPPAIDDLRGQIAAIAEPNAAWKAETDELRAQLASVVAQGAGWKAETDELRALIVAGEPAPFGALGSAAFQAVAAFDAAGAAATVQAASLQKSSNLSDVASAATSLANLGGASLTGTNTLSGSNTFSNPANITFGSNYQSWTPTVTGNGAMTISGLTVTVAQYIRIGPLVHFYLNVTFTTGGTANTDVNMTLPVAAAGTDFIPAIASGAPTALSQQNLLAFVSLPSSLALVRLSPIANWPLGSQSGIRVSGTYRCA